MAVDDTVRFLHPFARSVAYRAASAQERREAHAALAAVTDAVSDPDRRAWHRSEAADSPDETIARDLDHAATAAGNRGGLAATAAFRTRAAMLTPSRHDQVRRLVAAAEATRDAGALDTSLDLLELIDASTVGDREAGRIARLRAQISLVQRRTVDEPSDLLVPAAAIAVYDPCEAREACLEALVASLWTTDGDTASGVAEAISAISAIGPHDPAASPADDVVPLVLNGLQALVAQRTTTAVSTLRHATDQLLADPNAACPTLATLRAILVLPITLGDENAWAQLLERVISRARQQGALAVLACALDALSVRLMWDGDLASASGVIEQAAQLHAQTTGAVSPHLRMTLAAWEGDEAEALRLAAEIRAAPVAGPSAPKVFADYAEAVLANGTGRFEQAHTAALRLFGADLPAMSTLVATELADAASRTGAVEDLRLLDVWLRELVRTTPGPWVAGLVERVAALLSTGAEAETHYLDSMEHLGRTGSRIELARSELLYGEWLRRQGRRSRARDVLNAAHLRFRDAGAHAFTERAARELRAAGYSAVSNPRNGGLTAQEAQIAELAAEGLTNPEIGARLYISSRTVQYHLRSVYQKFGITSRSQLADVPAPLTRTS